MSSVRLADHAVHAIVSVSGSFKELSCLGKHARGDEASNWSSGTLRTRPGRRSRRADAKGVKSLGDNTASLAGRCEGKGGGRTGAGRLEEVSEEVARVGGQGMNHHESCCI